MFSIWQYDCGSLFTAGILTCHHKKSTGASNNINDGLISVHHFILHGSAILFHIFINRTCGFPTVKSHNELLTLEFQCYHLDIYSQFKICTHCFVLEELGELVSGLISMCIALPVVRHVVDMSQDNSQQLLRTKHHVLIRNK